MSLRRPNLRARRFAGHHFERDGVSQTITNGKWNLGVSSWSRAYFPKRTGNWVEVTNTAEIATAGNCGQMLNLGANSGTVVIGKNAMLEVVG